MCEMRSPSLLPRLKPCGPIASMPPSRQAGAAVLVAMLVVALATLAASSFMFRSHVEWRHLENMTRLDQAQWILRAAERWGAAVLMDDARQSSVDHLGEAWATQLPPVEAEGYQVSGRMEDQNGRFNLNNIVQAGKTDERQLLAFRRLLKALNLPDELATAAMDWMDDDDLPITQDSAENVYYSSLNPPYRAANRPLIRLNELLQVKGFNRDILVTLRPYVTALPTRTAVNLNTARPEVLVALVEGLTPTEAYAMVAKRERAYYRNVQDFQQALPAGLAFPHDMVSVSSHYFLAQARIRQGRMNLGSQALLQRTGSKLPQLVWRAEL